MRTRTFFLALGLAAAFPAAGFCAGITSVPFLRAEATARVSGMGGAAGALAGDAGGPYFNPAGLPFARANAVSFSTWNGTGPRSRLTFLSGVFRTGPIGTFGVSYLKFNSGNADILDLDTGHGGTIVEEDYALGLGWGRKLSGNFSLGVQLKLVSSEFLETRQNTTAAVDAGVMARSPGGRFSAGAGLRNSGGDELLSATAKAPLPSTVFLGAAAGFGLPDGSLLAALDIEKPEARRNPDARAGLEYSLDRFALRGGMKRAHNDTSFTAGAGARVGRLAADYSYEPANGRDRPVHKFTFAWSFGGRPEKAAGAPQVP